MADENQHTGITAEAMTAAMTAATAPLMSKIAELEAKLGAVQSQPPKQEPAPAYTRAQLDELVMNNRITQAQADELWQQQADRRTAELVRTTVTETMTGASREAEVASQIQAYAELVPDVAKPGTDERARVKEQYDALVASGLPGTRATELAALRVVYGSIEALRAAKRSKPDFEPNPETGGSGVGFTESVKGTNIKLSPDEKRYYQHAIDRGLYKDWKEVEAELKYANPALRARHAGGRAA